MAESLLMNESHADWAEEDERPLLALFTREDCPDPANLNAAMLFVLTSIEQDIKQGDEMDDAIKAFHCWVGNATQEELAERWALAGDAFCDALREHGAVDVATLVHLAA